MRPSTAAIAVAALVAICFAATAAAQATPAPAVSFCRTSAYTVDCATTKKIKTEMFKICGKGVIRAIGKYIPNRNGCGCSIVQKVDSSAVWDSFQSCQETKGQPLFKSLQDTRCKPGQAKGPC